MAQSGPDISDKDKENKVPLKPTRQLNAGEKRAFLNDFEHYSLVQSAITEEKAKKLFDDALELVKDANTKGKFKHRDGLTLKALKIIQDENIKRYINQELLKHVKNALAFANAIKNRDEKAFAEHMEKFKQHSNPIVSQAMTKQSYGERISHLAQFDQNSMAFMALADEIIFVCDFVLSITGAKLVLISKNNFDQLKTYTPEVVYDPIDYPYPLENTPEANGIRAATEKALLKRTIYDYKLLPTGSFVLDKESGPITDPRKISYEVAAANGLIHKPDPILEARHAVIDYWVRMIGKAPDHLFYIARQNEQQANPNKGGSNTAETQLQLAARMAAMKSR